MANQAAGHGQWVNGTRYREQVARGFLSLADGTGRLKRHRSLVGRT